MKKLIFFVLISIASSVFADLVYDPTTHVIYCKSKAKNIDQNEYRSLLRHCIQIENNIIVMVKNRKISPKKDFLNQCISYLRKVGTPTALQLIKDLKRDKVYYPDGSVMNKIYS